MNFIRLGKDAFLNLESVASVSWHGNGEDIAATVKYLVPTASREHQSQLAEETFHGEAAQALKNLLESSHEQRLPHKSSVRAGTTPEDMDMAVESLQAVFSGRARKKAWYFVRVNDRGYFIAMVNAKGSCSMRTFDAETGRFLGKRYAQGDYQDQFAEFLRDAGEVFLNQQPNLEISCRDRLPPDVLSSLQSQAPGGK